MKIKSILTALIGTVTVASFSLPASANGLWYSGRVVSAEWGFQYNPEDERFQPA